MKTKLYIIIIIMLGAFNSFAQKNDNDNRFYYYNGEKVYFKVNKSKLMIYYSEGVDFKDVLAKNHSLSRNIKSKGKIVGSEIYLPKTNNYSQEVLGLKKDKKIKDIEIVIGDSISVPVSNIFYVKLKKQSDISLLQNVVQKTKSKIIRRVENSDKWYAVEVDKNSVSDCIGIANIFYETGFFEDVDPGFIFNFSISCKTDDRFDEQWAINNSGVDINACGAWNITVGSNNVVVAVIDQGIDNNHDEFATTNFVNSYDAEDRTSPAQLHGKHGTLVCGIISADHDASEIAGVAPGVSIMEVSHPCWLSNTISEDYSVGINWAVQNGADILNNSWGDQGGEYFNGLHSTMLEDAIDNAINNGRDGLGCIVVFIAGNEAPSMDYPGTYSNDILTVGSINSNGMRSNISGFGNDLDIVAPGEGILSTIPNNGYEFQNGTSMAAPHVAGVAALILSVRPDLTGQQVRDVIEQTAQKIGGYSYTTHSNRPNGSWDDEMGYGLVDAYAAVHSVAPYITGPTNICNTNSTFTLHNRPSGANVTWSRSSNLAEVSGQGTSNYTVRRNGSGSAWVRASINGTAITRAIYIQDAPSFSIFGDTYLQSGMQGIAVLDYSNKSKDAAKNRSVTWGCSAPIASINGTSSSAKYRASTHEGGYGVVWAKVTNLCSSITERLYVRVQNPSHYKLFPNPAKTSLTVQLTNTGQVDTKAEANVPYEIEIWNDSQIKA